jgi:hypothetical protein
MKSSFAGLGVDSVEMAVVGCGIQLLCGEDVEQSSAWSCNELPIAAYQTRTVSSHEQE